MAIPWVSRELYDRVVEELQRSEAERKVLLDRLLTQNGVAPLTPAAFTAVLPVPGSAAAEELVDEGTGAISIPRIVAMAEAAAKRKAGLA